MIAGDFRHRFQSSCSLFRASRSSKLRRGHIKLAYSKVLELAAKRLGIGINRMATLFWGPHMTVIYPDPTSLAISRYGFYEEGLTTMVLDYLKPGMTFLDIGAHVGYFTLLGDWLVGDSGQVHSFEPTPSTFDVLRSNTESKQNIHLNRIALSSVAGLVTMNNYGPEFSGYNSIYRARMFDETLSRVNATEFKAETISVDEYVDREQLTPDFVKIDAESAEFEILKGMEQTLNRCRPMISVEVGDMDIEGVIPCKDLVMYVLNKGYDAYEFNGSRIVKHRLRERYEYDNILFLPLS